MQIRKVTVGCFLSAIIVLVGVLWTFVVKNIELQKNSLLDNEVSPKGYRLLGRISKLTKKDIEKLINKYNSISKLQDVPDEELSDMKISKVKIKALKSGLKRLKLTVELEKV